jgi:hypothetical protein
MYFKNDKTSERTSDDATGELQETIQAHPERTHPSTITPCGDHPPGSHLAPALHIAMTPTHKPSRLMRLQRPLGRCMTLPGGPSRRLLRASAAEMIHDDCSAAGTLARLCSRHLTCARDLYTSTAAEAARPLCMHAE